MSMNSLDVQKKFHELLLSNKPSEDSHDESLCPLCEVAVDGAVDSAPLTDTQGGDNMSNKTYTEDELQEAIEAALAPVAAELADFKASQDQAAIESRITELNEVHQAAVAELQTELEAAKASAEAEATKHNELVAFLEEEAASAAEEERLVARREEVKELVSGLYDDKYIESRLDSWAAMSAEDLDALVADAKAVRKDAAAAGDEKKKVDVASTAMQAGLEMDSSDASVSDTRRSLHRQRSALRAVGSRSN